MANNIQVLISDESYIADNKLTVSNQAGAISNASIDVKINSGQEIPRALESVQVLFDETPVFFGIINSVTTADYSYGTEVDKVRLDINSSEIILQWRLVSEAYESKYTHEIIQSLFDNYISQEGITLGSISTTENLYDTYTASYLKLSDVLDELADDIGASYFISPDKKFYFLVKNDIELIDAPAHIKGVKLEESGSDVRTVQIVAGASEETTPQSEGLYWAADQQTMTLGYQPSSVSSMAINGNPVGVGLLGVDEEDVTKTFLWKYGSQIITLNSNATTKPTTGDNVVIIYNGYYDIIVQNQNDSLVAELSALNGTSGKIEAIETDETIESFADADTLANNLLQQNDEREQTVSATCLELSKTDLLTAWRFNLPTQHIVGDYVITKRTISDFYDKYLIKVTLKNKGFYCRYGTVLKEVDKTVRTDAVIYKQTTIGDTANATDSVVIDADGNVFYPASVASGLINDPGLADGFYPQEFV